jgi:hypothetical protein
VPGYFISQLHSLSGPAVPASRSLPRKRVPFFPPPLCFGEAFAGLGEWMLVPPCKAGDASEARRVTSQTLPRKE